MRPPSGGLFVCLPLGRLACVQPGEGCVPQVHPGIGLRQPVRPVLVPERQPCLLEHRLGLVEAGGAAEWWAGNVDLHMPQPDAGRPRWRTVAVAFAEYCVRSRSTKPELLWLELRRRSSVANGARTTCDNSRRWRKLKRASRKYRSH